MSRSAVSRSLAGARPRTAPAGILGSPLSFDGGYLQRSQLPLTCAAFLLPFLVVYEVGTLCLPDCQVVAFAWVQRLFRYCHADAPVIAPLLPALAVMVILVCWHAARRDPWKLHVRDIPGMYVESAILSLPLLALAVWRCHVEIPRSLATAHAIASCGAGVYEELVFRLGLCTLLSILLTDVLKLRETQTILPIVCLSGVSFALYHYQGGEVSDLPIFLFRVLGGIYFGFLFVTRGFGITAGTHAFYDLLLIPIALMKTGL